MIKFIFLTFFLLSNFSNLNASDIRINSIITLENNIPKECGLNFKILEGNKMSDTKVSIKKNQDKKKFEIENNTDVNKTNMFFQEILISGGKILINDKTYEVIGPIDSKVRLEYLFCTGEMFLPNYEKNR